ncbi:hypothetical protein [Actinophytocola glycyrrhizae]|uniref:LXG domain-containing protein n=1 Tax=Actinophytocola glycyrrhizae TaxID=2044873 RepID=A0ABV9S6E1_9PSEU
MTRLVAKLTGELNKGFLTVTGAVENLIPLEVGKGTVHTMAAYLSNRIEDVEVHAATRNDPLYSKEEILDTLAAIAPTVDMKIDKIDMVVAACDPIAELEVIRNTNRGKDVLHAVENLRATRAKAENLRKKIGAFTEEMNKPEGPSEERLGAFNRFVPRFLRAIEVIDKHADIVAQQWQKALTDEAIKAWVQKHPTAGHKAMTAALAATDQGINAVALTGEILGYLPNEEAQGVSIGLTVGASVAETGKAVTDRWMNSVSADIQIAQYKKKNGTQAIYAELDSDKTLIAERLATKRKADVALALQLTQPIWTAAAVKFPPGVGDLWPMVCDVINKCVEKYQEERIQRALRLVGEGAEKEDILLVFGKEYLDELLEGIKGNVFAVLNPMKLAATAFITTLAGRIAAAVVEKLPVKPAELIDGAALRGHIESLVTAQLQSSFLEPSIVEDRFSGLELPTEVDGVAVTAILSGVEGSAPRRHVYLRLADGTVGRWLETGEFDKVDDDEDEGARYLGVPTTDEFGRKLSEVFAGVVVPHPDTGEDSYRARYQDLAGFVTVAAPHRFTVTGPHDTAYADWSRRAVTPEGYQEIVGGRPGDMVRGQWHQPWQGKPVYLFVHASGGAREWAHGTANTGAPGLRVFGQLDGKVPVEYDLTGIR